MIERDWLPGATLDLDPDAIEDYEADFTTWLDGETLGTVDVLYENCLAVLRGAPNGSLVTFRVSEVDHGAQVTLRVNSSSGRRNDFTTFYRPTAQ